MLLWSPQDLTNLNKSQLPWRTGHYRSLQAGWDFPHWPEVSLGIELMSQLRILGMCWRLHGEALIALLDDTKQQPNHMFLMQPKMEEIVVKSFVWQDSHVQNVIEVQKITACHCHALHRPWQLLKAEIMYPPTCTNSSKLVLFCHHQPSALSRIKHFNVGSENGESSPLSALLVPYLWEDEKHYLLPRQRISQLDKMIYRMNNHIMTGMRQMLYLLQLCTGWSCIKWSHLVITVTSRPAKHHCFSLVLTKSTI